MYAKTKPIFILVSLMALLVGLAVVWMPGYVFALVDEPHPINRWAAPPVRWRPGIDQNSELQTVENSAAAKWSGISNTQ